MSNGYTVDDFLHELGPRAKEPIVLSRVEDPRIAALEAENARLTAERDEARDGILSICHDEGMYDGDSVESGLSCIKANLRGFHRMMWDIVDLFAFGSAAAEDVMADLRRIADEMRELRADRERLEAMIAYGWVIRGSKFEVDSIRVTVGDDRFVVGRGKTAREAIDDARKAGA